MGPTTLTRREALAGAGGLLAGVAGCNGPAARPAAEDPTPAVSPGRRTDPAHLMVRTGDGDPVVYVEREDDGAARTSHRRGFVASAEDRAALGFADADGTADARAFLAATDFEMETVFYRREAIRECYRRELCSVGWTARSIDLRFADVLRPATVNCEAGARDGLTTFVRIPAPLDPEAVSHYSAGHSVGRGGCRNRSRNRERADGREHALTAAEAAENLARARAAVDDAGHLADRLRGDGTRDLRDRFAAAARALGRRLDERRRALPDAEGDPGALVDRDVSDTPAEWTLEVLYRTVATETTPVAGERRLARRVLRRHGALAAAGALETVRTRVGEGETFVPATAADVRARREVAVDAVQAVRGAEPYPGLVDEELVELVGGLRRVDDRIGNAGDSVRPEAVAREVGTYVRVETTARALPAASRVTGDALVGDGSG